MIETNAKSWIMQYIGKPWEAMSRGDDSFDCWGLVWHIYKHQFNITLPLHSGIDPKERLRVAKSIIEGALGWVICGVEDGSVVTMSQSKVVHHVGIYLAADGGVILHSCDGKGVIAESLSKLNAQNWSLEFYRYNQEKRLL